MKKPEIAEDIREAVFESIKTGFREVHIFVSVIDSRRFQRYLARTDDNFVQASTNRDDVETCDVKLHTERSLRRGDLLSVPGGLEEKDVKRPVLKELVECLRNYTVLQGEKK